MFPQYSAFMTDSGVVDLLGALACAELTAFLRMAQDAATLAPTLTDRARLGEVAVTEFGHFRLLRDRLVELGADPDEAMAPFAAAVDAWHDQTEPADWLEALVKAHVGLGIALDFYRAAADYVDPSVKPLVEEVVADQSRADFAVERVRAAVTADPARAGRLALWARRLVGEALSQAQQVVAARPELAGLLAEALAGAERSDVSALFAQLQEEHGKRMAALGL